MAKWIIPTPLRKFTGNLASVDLDGDNVSEAVELLVSKFPELKKHLLDSEGKLRSFVRIYVGEEDIRSLQGDRTTLKTDSVVSIIPAIAGG